jgi:hypothetical protein
MKLKKVISIKYWINQSQNEMNEKINGDSEKGM